MNNPFETIQAVLEASNHARKEDALRALGNIRQKYAEACLDALISDVLPDSVGVLLHNDRNALDYVEVDVYADTEVAEKAYRDKIREIVAEKTPDLDVDTMEWEDVVLFFDVMRDNDPYGELDCALQIVPLVN